MKELQLCVALLATILLIGCGTLVKVEPLTCSVTGNDICIRVNCGADEKYVDKAGKEWLPDQEYAKGKTLWGAGYGSVVERDEEGVLGNDSPEIYITERYSMSNYVFDVPDGRYTVRLHFAETFSGITAAGERVFDVSINKQQVLKDFDPYKEAGFFKPIVREFKGIEVSDGRLLIGFGAKVENPEINGIEVVRE